MSYNVDKRALGIKALIRIMEEIRESYPRLEMGQIVVLLHIIGSPGVRASDLQKKTGLSKSTLSWTIRSLGTGLYQDDSSGTEKQGQNLISQVPDPMDSRAKLLAPTALGRRLGDKIEEIIGDANDKTTGPPMAS